YDALDRPTRVTYPDSSYEQTTYDKLDPVVQRDRLGRLTRMFYDPLRRVVAVRDPLGRTTSQFWCACGSLDALVDANGQRTSFQRDVSGRTTREVRNDGSTATTYVYEATNSRLKTKTDPRGQVTNYSYNLDNTVQSLTHTNAAIATPGVTYTYDPNYSRLATMVDGIGTTSYTYYSVGVLGALQMASAVGPLPNATVTYTYDELGRLLTRAINGTANQTTQTYDPLGRVITEVNPLGTFNYGYDGVISRLASVTFPNGQTATYTYFGDAGNRRVSTLQYKNPDGTNLSKFDYT